MSRKKKAPRRIIYADPNYRSLILFPSIEVLYIFELIIGQVRKARNYLSLPSFLICALILVADICCVF